MNPGTTEPPADEAAEASDFGYAWVTLGSVEDFIQRIQAMREGDAPTAGGRAEDCEEARPAIAIRALQAFAIMRPIPQLIEASRDFDSRDAVNVLATAALCRSVPQAAELAVGQWQAEGERRTGRTPLTDVIIHDIACQRTALHVAEFIARLGIPQLVNQTLEVFARTSSGRTHLDKALLYIALRDEGYAEQAGALLRLTIDAINANDSSQGPSATDPAELHDLVGALHQLSPSEQILEKWIREELDDADRMEQTVKVVARLITSRSNVPDSLTKDVGTAWEEWQMVRLCGELADSSPDACATIRAYAASRTNRHELARIIINWQKSEKLAKTTKDLIHDIAAGGTGATKPRQVTEIHGVHTWLNNHAAPALCNRLLWNAAAHHVDGRSGNDLVTILSNVKQGRDRQRVAQRFGKELAVRVLTAAPATDRPDAAIGLFVDYVRELRRRNLPDEVRPARRELADPSGLEGTVDEAAALIAEIADRLYGESLTVDGWDLLERYLENEQRVRPADVVVVVERLRSSAMSARDRRLLLRATVGRWSDAHRRNEAIGELKDGGFDTEAAQVIRSLR